VDWERAYALHAAEILRYLRRLSRDASNAEDLMQETFVRAERAARVPADAELRPWLYRIATNLAIDHLRRGRRIAFMPFSGREPDERAAFDDSGDAVRHALRAIPAEQAVTLILRLHEGYSRAEIARLTGVSERAVKVRLEHGRESFARAYRRERDHR
jgi:RNA polymerase sigma-70 factor (ECF subfamily)